MYSISDYPEQESAAEHTTHRPRRLSRRVATGVAMGASVLLVVSACGSDKKASAGDSSAPATTTGSSSTTGAAKDLLPKDLKDKGSISVATSIGFPPYEFYAKDGKTVQGIDIDIVNAIGVKLGVKMNIVDTRFPTIIPGLQNKRSDLAISSIEDNAERRKSVDFVDYMHSGYAMIVTTANPAGLTSQDDLCGKKISGVTGQVIVTFLQADSKSCVDNGKKAIDLQLFPKTTDATLAVGNGRTEGMVTAFGPASYLASTNKAFKIVGDVTHKGITGIAVPQGSTELEKALQAAVQEIIDDGSYAKILQTWGLADLALTKATINGQS